MKVGDWVKLTYNPFQAELAGVDVIGKIGEVVEAPARGLTDDRPMQSVVIVKVDDLYLYAYEHKLETL